MKGECIGVFDSGLGGLTVLKQIIKFVPNVNIVYFGDTKHAPYGDRSQAELKSLTKDAFNFLKSKGVTKIVTACNSVSTLLVDNSLSTYDLYDDVIEMSKPTAQSLAGKYDNVLVLATAATVESHMYKDALLGLGIHADERALSGLVDMIEQGVSKGPIEEYVVNAVGGLDVSKYDAVLLGCTHFPLILSLFKNVIGNGVEYIDPAAAVARVVSSKFGGKGDADGRIYFFVSKESKVFNQEVKKIFGDRYKVTVV